VISTTKIDAKKIKNGIDKKQDVGRVKFFLVMKLIIWGYEIDNFNK
jgi:hypothetical protein